MQSDSSSCVFKFAMFKIRKCIQKKHNYKQIMLSHSLFFFNILHSFAGRRWIEQLKGHKLDHALRGKEFRIIWMLLLLFVERKDGPIEQSAESVVVEFTHGHIPRQLFVVLKHFLQMLKHLWWVTTAQRLSVLFFLLLLFCFDAGVEPDFAYKFFVFRGLIGEAHVYVFDLSAVFEHVD